MPRLVMAVTAGVHPDRQEQRHAEKDQSRGGRDHELHQPDGDGRSGGTGQPDHEWRLTIQRPANRLKPQLGSGPGCRAPASALISSKNSPVSSSPYSAANAHSTV
jgi:hypothetical protein